MNIEELMAQVAGQGKRRHQPPKPATPDQVRQFLGGVERFSVGDIVVWREGLCASVAPAPGEQCVVTQVLAEPLRGGDNNVAMAERLDIALAFLHHCGEEDCEAEDAVFDAMFDSRRFTKVGSIYD